MHSIYGVPIEMTTTAKKVQYTARQQCKKCNALDLTFHFWNDKPEMARTVISSTLALRINFMGWQDEISWSWCFANLKQDSGRAELSPIEMELMLLIKNYQVKLMERPVRPVLKSPHRMSNVILRVARQWTLKAEGWNGINKSILNQPLPSSPRTHETSAPKHTIRVH